MASGRSIVITSVRILIDECLSPDLVRAAQQAGYEAYHVAHRGWAGLRDAQLYAIIVKDGFTLVTNNRDDFLTLVRRADLHPGLIVILPNVRADRQVELFGRALDLLRNMGSMINRVIEVELDGTTLSYEIPSL